MSHPVDANDVCPPIPEARAVYTRIYVSVHGIGGDHYPGDATVLLRQQGVEIQLQRAEGRILYETIVSPGTYILDVAATFDDLIAPSRQMVIPSDGKIASAYLGQKDWPDRYRLGENLIPFKFHDDLLAVVFETKKLPPDPAVKVATMLASQFELDFLNIVNPGNYPAFMAANGAIWFFKLRCNDAHRQSEVAKGMRKSLAQYGYRARVGVPVDLNPGQIKVLDNRFVVQFHESQAQNVHQIAEKAGARICRRFIQAPDTYLLVFEGETRANLDAIECWFGQDKLIFGEPDLLSELIYTGLPDGPAWDAKYPDQKNLPLQHVDSAWKFLSALDPDHSRMLGSPDVYVATFDTGVQIDHPDIDPGKIVVNQDFSNMVDCMVTADVCKPDNAHGMGVYGIIAARTDNYKPLDGNIAGIAPNTRQIAIRCPEVLSAHYHDVLLWIAGFQPHDVQDQCDEEVLPENWPSNKIGHRADIINCSHVSPNLACSGLTDATLVFLTTNGRDTRGTVMVYAAGTSNSCITGTSPWATHERSIAVASTDEPLDCVERRSSSSPFGPEIDLCARGTGVLTLDNQCDDVPFDGTSAAAPTVTAAAALMLSVNPDLSWDEVRRILCNTALPIDLDQQDPNGTWTPEPDAFSGYYGHGRLRVLEAVQEACHLAGKEICWPRHVDNARPV